MTSRRVAVIGAGVGGLAAIKACIEEDLEPVCFEQADTIGGLWNMYPDGPPKDLNLKAQMFANIILNTSKQITAFSDFPMPKDCPDFPPCKQLIEYFKNYAEHFNLLRHIRFHKRVTNVARSADYDLTGRWVVTCEDRTEEGRVEEDTFEGVMVCDGILQKQIIPDFPGMDEFSGEIVHSGHYYDSNPYKDMVIVVVGDSYSAVDMAVDVCKTAKKTYLSTRNGLWVMPRLIDGHVPYDHELTSRKLYAVNSQIAVTKKYTDRLLARFDHDKFDVKPRKPFMHMSMCVNDEIEHRLMYGQVKARPEIKRLTPTGVLFTDDSSAEEVDVLLLGTGFTSSCSFLEDKTIYPEEMKNRCLYKNIFPVGLKHPTLAVIGKFYVYGPFAPAMELQSRLVARVLAGKLNLPDVETMRADVDSIQESIRKQFGKPGEKIFCAHYQEDIAGVLGVRPPLTRMLLSDPKLAWKCFSGPRMAAHFRLHGPGEKADLARAIIMGEYHGPA